MRLWGITDLKLTIVVVVGHGMFYYWKVEKTNLTVLKGTGTVGSQILWLKRMQQPRGRVLACPFWVYHSIDAPHFPPCSMVPPIMRAKRYFGWMWRQLFIQSGRQPRYPHLPPKSWWKGESPKRAKPYDGPTLSSKIQAARNDCHFQSRGISFEMANRALVIGL